MEVRRKRRKGIGRILACMLAFCMLLCAPTTAFAQMRVSVAFMEESGQGMNMSGADAQNEGTTDTQKQSEPTGEGEAGDAAIFGFSVPAEEQEPTEQTPDEDTPAEQELTEQMLTADLEDYQVEVSGNMPQDASLQVVIVPQEMAQDIVDANTEVILAMDISILSGEEKYQPEDFGEQVTVTVRGIDAESVLHIKKDVTDGDGNLDVDAVAEAVQEIESGAVEAEALEISAEEDGVSFELDSFSLLLLASQAPRKAAPGGGSAGGRTKVTITKVWEGDEGLEELRQTPKVHLSPLEGYTQLQWIQSGSTYTGDKGTGLPYINTGVKLTGNSRIIADFQYVDQHPGSGYRFTGDQTISYASFRFGTYCAGSNKYSWFARYGSSSSNSIVPAGSNDEFTARNRVELDKNGFRVNGNTRYTFSAQTFTTTNNAYIFAINTNNSTVQDQSPAYLYSYKILENDALVRDYIPVKRNSDGAVGLYDLCERKFYGSANSYRFIAGPAVPSEKYTSVDADWIKNGNTWSYTFTVPNNDIVYEAYEEPIANYTCEGNPVLVKTVEYDGNGSPIVDYPDKDQATFTNKLQPYTLTVNKTVSGNMGSKTEYFPFTISVNFAGLEDVKIDLTNADATVPALSGRAEQPNPDKIQFAGGSGSATIWLQHGQSFSLTLPKGASYTVSEPDSVDYVEWVQAGSGEKTKGNSASGTLSADTGITFDNNKNTPVPTGVHTERKVIIAGILLAVLLAGVLWAGRRRRYD